MYKKNKWFSGFTDGRFRLCRLGGGACGLSRGLSKNGGCRRKEGKVVIYSTTDTKAAGPLIKGFEAQYPGVKVEYNDMNSTELYNRYISEQAAGAAAGTWCGARRWIPR